MGGLEEARENEEVRGEVHVLAGLRGGRAREQHRCHLPARLSPVSQQLPHKQLRALRHDVYNIPGDEAGKEADRMKKRSDLVVPLTE